jgi:hypothetical protein
MSALGQKRTLDRRPPMSALPPKADIDEGDCHVRFVPIADMGVDGSLSLGMHFMSVARQVADAC